MNKKSVISFIILLVFFITSCGEESNSTDYQKSQEDLLAQMVDSLDDKDLIFIKGDSAESVTQNFLLPLNIEIDDEVAELQWSSSNKHIEISTDGSVTINPSSSEDVLVRLNVEITLGNLTDSKDVIILIKKRVVTFTASFNTNGGSLIEPVKIDSGLVIVEPKEPELEGNQFDAWFADKGLTKAWDFSSIISKNMTLYAKWQKDQITISFEVNGGKAIDAVTINTNSALDKPDSPQRDGYSFEGWYTDKELTKAFDFKSNISNSMTLYAKWQGNPYQISFNKNSPEALGAIGNKIEQVGALVELPTEGFERIGYVLVGWSESSTGSDVYNAANPYEKKVGDITLYAVWEKGVYSITFDANGGAGSIPSQKAEFETTFSLPSGTGFSKTGYILQGWSTTQSGPVKYPDEGIFTMGVQSVTLFAVWKDMWEDNPNQFLSPDGLIYKPTNNKTELVVFDFIAQWDSVSLVIPDQVNGLKVVAIDELAFYSRDKIYSVEIPSTVKTIGENAFKFARKLTHVTMAEGLETIAKQAFAKCTSLRTINLPTTIKRIGDSTFYDVALTDLTIPEGITKINDGLFTESTSLLSITLPTTILEMGMAPFKGCSALVELNMRANLAPTTDGSYLFGDVAANFNLYTPSGSTGYNGSSWIK